MQTQRRSSVTTEEGMEGGGHSPGRLEPPELGRRAAPPLELPGGVQACPRLDFEF